MQTHAHKHTIHTHSFTTTNLNTRHIITCRVCSFMMHTHIHMHTVYMHRPQNCITQSQTCKLLCVFRIWRVEVSSSNMQHGGTSLTQSEHGVTVCTVQLIWKWNSLHSGSSKVSRWKLCPVLGVPSSGQQGLLTWWVGNAHCRVGPKTSGIPTVDSQALWESRS